ncbi:uncharacterized protein BT62DRAFT_304616 [Guyanagaster necrorhizus]|uniref:DUF6534 domain-containing protein n=1 Tax=Guyanagaster necrorhizus TaxID=856835 RepID=A0A9P8AQ17_9AGAR|nr:uncharacterized protein BT62DRAFT_304616 [Guyanagaster necrorhizus MCA 3950]KAG7443913.1 hypothetical protein BT62DRAFT_304616 [Guyanagaster necrorhizus MCA 3950]
MIPDFSLDKTIGAAFIGVVVAAILHGVSCVQAWYYFTHQHDQWPLKSIVTAVIVLDTVHQVLIFHTVYSYLVGHYGDETELQKTVWSLLAEVLLNGFTAFLVQSFLALRVWRLSSENFVVTAIVALLVIAEFGCIIAFGTLALIHVHTFVELARLKYLSISVNALAAAGDVFIAGTLCLLLHRSRTGFQNSDTMINKLILFAVNTGLLTSLCAVASLISILTAPNTFIYITFFFCMGRLYSNSLLATLNARKRIRTAAEGINTCGEIGFSLNDISKVSTFSSHRGSSISIKIDTTKEFSSDVGHNVVLAGPPTENGLPDTLSSKASCAFQEMIDVA